MGAVFVLFWLCYLVVTRIRHGRVAASTLVLFVGSLLFSLNLENADREMYKGIFEAAGFGVATSHGSDLLFFEACRLAQIIGLSFDAFYCLCINLGLGFLHEFALSRTRRASECIAAYCCTGMLLDYVQIRQFIASCIVLFGVGILASGRRLSATRYAVCVTVAAGFHVSALAYVVLLGFRGPRLRRAFVMGLAMSAVVSVVALNNDLAVSMMAAVTEDATAAYYLVSRHQIESPVFTLACILWQQGFLLALVLYSQARQTRQAGSKGGPIGNRDSSDFAKLAVATNVGVASLSPLSFASSQFRRLSRLSLMPGLIVVASGQTSDIRVRVLLVVYVVGYASLVISANPTLLSDLFTHNWLLSAGF